MPNDANPARDLFPAQWDGAFSFLGDREEWVLRPQTVESLDEFQDLIAGVHDWAVSCIKYDVQIRLDPQDAHAWKLMGYLHIDIFVLIFTIAVEDDALATMCRVRSAQPTAPPEIVSDPFVSIARERISGRCPENC